MNLIKIRGMSVALIFKKINDLSVTNSMEEDYQNRGAKCNSGGKTMNLHSNTKDGTLKCENRQKKFKEREK